MVSDALSHIRIVLVETSHPGNIGATARAMKTMGLHELYLVNPQRFPAAEATARAAGADDVLSGATIVSSLAEALCGCALACATTARRRVLSVSPRTPRDCAADLIARASEGTVAIVFGRESSGLSNTEVLQCQAAIEIPANAQYSSLNLASAVQLIAYELRVAWLAPQSTAPQRKVATVSQLEGLYAHLQSALTTIGFLNEANPRKLMLRLRALFARADLDHSELQILRGILTAAQAHNMDARVRREQRNAERGVQIEREANKLD